MFAIVKELYIEFTLSSRGNVLITTLKRFLATIVAVEKAISITGLTLKNFTFCHIVFVCFVCIAEPIATFALYNAN